MKIVMWLPPVLDYESNEESTTQRILEQLYHATTADDIVLYCSGMGGDCLSLARLINAIVLCNANTITVVANGPCFSAHALLALNKYVHLEVDPIGVYFMFHDVQFLPIERGGCSLYKEFKFRTDSFWKVYMDGLGIGDLLTDKELESMRAGEELFFDSKTILKRVRARNVKYFQKAVQDFQKEEDRKINKSKKGKNKREKRGKGSS